MSEERGAGWIGQRSRAVYITCAVALGALALLGLPNAVHAESLRSEITSAAGTLALIYLSARCVRHALECR